jgi:hypothetical protein
MKALAALSAAPGIETREQIHSLTSCPILETPAVTEYTNWTMLLYHKITV